MIYLDHCTVEWVEQGARTVFPDGTETVAHPHPEEHHYHVISHRCGYGSDVMKYCREHELAHAFLAQEFRSSPSYVLQSIAQGNRPRSGRAILEEMAVQMFQRWCRANERPIIANCDWDALKDKFLDFANNEGLAYATRSRLPRPEADPAPAHVLYHVHD